MIKPKQLTIRGIGKIVDTVIEINKPLILFYGEIKQGKTTILNCVRWVCGGEFPQDIINHNCQEGVIELKLEDGMIGRSFYRAKDGSVKARPVTFIRDGKPVKTPVTEIRKLLNPFLLDQDFLRNKSELERKQYFTELFNVDTGDLDAEALQCQRDAQALRSKISGYGEIELVKVEPVDVSALREELEKIKSQNAAIESAYEIKCETYNERLNFRASKVLRKNQLKAEMEELEKRLTVIRNEHESVCISIDQNPQLPEPVEPAYLSTDKIEESLREAGATNVRAEQYQKNLARSKAKEEDNKKLLELERRQREIKVEKQAKLKSISENCGVPGLSFDESGNFIYDGTTAGMISDSQIMRLSSELSALYPDGFGLDLIDRAESLGKSIFEFVDRAKAEKKTIMATIVGEKPSNIPEEIGVFVVENGNVN